MWKKMNQGRCSIKNQDILVKAGEGNLSYSVIKLRIKWGWGGTIGNLFKDNDEDFAALWFFAFICPHSDHYQ